MAKSSLEEFLSSLFGEVNIDNDKYSVIGDDADSKFIVKFSGAAGLAIRHAEHAQRSLRDGRGKYKELQVNKPAGGQTRIFVNPDRNPYMQKMLRESKRLGDIFRADYPSIRWHVNRIDGEISKGWTPIVKIEVHEGEAVSRLLWNLNALSDTTVNKEDIVSKFSVAGQRAPVAWSV